MRSDQLAISGSAGLPRSFLRPCLLFPQLALLRRSAGQVANYKQRYEDEFAPYGTRSKVAVLLLLQLQNLVGVLLVRSSTPRSILDSLLKCKHTETGCVNCNARCNAPADHIKSALRQVRHDCSCKGSEHDVYKQLKERNACV